ncbi:tRNA uridine-5-carboxymethylaminomethyl(34) synthesis GTPase MnmE [Desulfospira joergensenii]|uniref:tRNA uridine-5-carboxymethylaminomethyl(34) synthesis GTPase MnmE n=1 Tax=Desulfospira joergensenii TaxID=53329 RepID=UPI0003B5B016|nr:tRNA uridine-5-carboxymethylaminomethyl(34) synthesis GTPase MnmE [Desulfospira joergensenii]
MNDTIAAIATPYGSGGIGVIRISGPLALDIAAQVFSRTKTPEPSKSGSSTESLTSHTVFHGYILDDPAEVIDEVLVIPMKGPRSYTAEDVVEIQAHSGTLVLRTILDRILDKGARLAEPGEFTKRAFLNQRIDLTQAEAVADIINARSGRALKFAASQNLGTLKNEIFELRETLIAFLAILEVSIDFPDDEDSASISEKDIPALDQVIDQCREFIRQHDDACFLKEGIRIAICGKPNVGKSSLMNRLLTREKSIVTPLPGTTRDPIEEGLNMDGIPFVIIDTAGIHDTADLVEIIGIEKARDHIETADLVLFMKEPGSPFTAREFQKTVPEGKKAILVINKMDLAEEGEKDLPLPPPEYSHIPVAKISALLNQGIRELKQKIVNLCIQDLDTEGSAVIPNLRHKKALEETVAGLESVKLGLKTGQEEETLAIDIKNSIDALGKITGETASLDILDTIFNNFCIGK